MSREEYMLLTLAAYLGTMIALGLYGRGRTRSPEDFYLAGRRLGPWVAAVSASASSSSAWTLLGVSGAAFAWGWPAVWLIPACVGGFVINWYWVASRLRTSGGDSGAVTLTDFLCRGNDRHWRRRLALAASSIILFSFIFYVAAQFQGAGNAFAATFAVPRTGAILLGVAIVLIYTLLGGFWAVSLTDTLQGLLMAITAVVLPWAALAAVGGPTALVQALPPDFRLSAPLVSLLFVAGTLGIAFGYPGQPHVLNRFLALRDNRSLRRARLIAVTWSVLVYTGMVLLGLCARVLLTEGKEEQVFFLLLGELFPPVVAGVMLAAVLSAIMSTSDSQLLVAASSVTHDLGLRRPDLWPHRLALAAICAVAALLALYLPQTIFARVLFAWHSLGSAFGPLVLVRLFRGPVVPGFALAAILTGFTLTVMLHWLPDTPGDALERLLPFAAALAIALRGGTPPQRGRPWRAG